MSSAHKCHLMASHISSVFYIMGGSPGDVSEEPETYEKRKNRWRMNCDVGKATKGLENETMNCGVGELTEWLENELCS